MHPSRVVSLMLTVCAYGALVTTASASTVEVVPEPADRGPWAGIKYIAAPQEANRIVLVTVDEQTLEVSDAGAVISPGRGCVSVDPHAVRCSTRTFPGGLGLIGSDVRVGDMDDVVESRGPGLSADGGPGDDLLSSSSIVAGELSGGGGHDTLLGGSNTDTFIDGDTSGAADSDVMDGRGGGAEVSYAGRTAPVRVDLARGSGGEAGEGDVLRSVSAATGGAGADQMVGDLHANGLHGGPGADRLVGLAGDDFIEGGPGQDRLDGGTGGDYLNGGAGRDTVIGGSGNDTIDGGRGRDQLRGGSGDDGLFSGAAVCGAGRDELSPTRNDYVSRDCEEMRFFFPTRYADLKAVELAPYPRRQGLVALTFRVRCPYEETDGYPDPVQLRGSVRLTTPGGALVGSGRIPPAGRRCAQQDSIESSTELPHVAVRAYLTATGRRVLSRRTSTRVTVRFTGVNVPPAPWQIKLHG